jgi:hypothetical protein
MYDLPNKGPCYYNLLRYNKDSSVASFIKGLGIKIKKRRRGNILRTYI